MVDGEQAQASDDGADAPAAAPSPSPAGDVAQRTVKGAAWYGASRVLGQALRAIRLLILAALLGDAGPTQLGLFGVALLTLNTVEALSQTGLSQALIQRAGDVGAHLPSAFSVQLARGSLLSGILFVCAPYVAAALGKPEAEAPLRALAGVPLLKGMQSIGIVFFLKDLRFKRIVAMDVGSAVLDLTVCAAAAFVEPTVWALVWGYYAGAGFSLVASYVLAERRAWPGMSLERLRELSRFGTWVFVGTAIDYALIAGGEAAIGAMLPAAALGMYQMASRFAVHPTLEIARVIGVVSFPALSLLQAEPGRMQRAFLKSFFVASVIAVGASGFIIALAPELVAVLLPPQWAEVAPIMQLLALWGASRGLHSSHANFLRAGGRPATASVVPLVLLVAFAVGVGPAVSGYGVNGVAGLLLVIGSGAQLLLYPFLVRPLGISSTSIHLRLLVAVSAAGAGIAACVGLRTLLLDLPDLARAVALGVVYVIAAVAVLGLWNATTSLKVLPMVVEIVERVLRRRRA